MSEQPQQQVAAPAEGEQQQPAKAGGVAATASSVFSMFGKGVKSGARMVSSGVSTATRPIRQKRADGRVLEFYTIFDVDPETDKILAEFGGDVIAAEGKLSGMIYITDRSFCFHCKDKDDLKVVIPLNTIERIVRTVKKAPEADPNAPPGQPIANVPTLVPADPNNPDLLRPDSVQLYTTDRMVHQIFNILEYVKFINLMELLQRVNASRAPPPAYQA